MSDASNQKGNFMMYVGLGFSLIGIVLYDPLGLLFQWHRIDSHRARSYLHVVSYKYSSEVEVVNKAVENFEKR